MKSQFKSILEVDMKLELIQIDQDGRAPGVFHHLFISRKHKTAGNFTKKEKKMRNSDGSNRQNTHPMARSNRFNDNRN